MEAVLLKTKVQIIIFQSRTDELGKSFATSEKRITISEAGDILLDRGIEYKEVLKVKYEFIELEIPLTEIEKYVVQWSLKLVR